MNWHNRLRDGAGRLRGVLAWSAPLLWRTDRKSCALLLATSLAGALLAPATVAVMAHIVSLVQANFQQRGATVANLQGWILLAGAATFLAVSAGACRQYAQRRLLERVGLTARRMVLLDTARRDLRELESPATQNELSIVTGDPGAAIVKSVTELVNVLSAAIRVAGLAGIMVVIQPGWTLAVVGVSAPILIASAAITVTRHRLRRLQADVRRWSRYYARHLTNYQLVPAVRLLGLSDWMIENSCARVVEMNSAQRRVDRWELGARIAGAAVSIGLLVLALTSVATATNRGVVGVGHFVAFWVAAWRLVKDSGTLATSSSSAARSWLTVDHLRQHLNRNTYRNAVAPRPPGQVPSPLQGAISIDGVSFRYPDAARDTLQEVSLDIAAGETLAIVGHNGAGKTTLAKIIAGLYAPDQGALYYDGVRHCSVDWSAMHRHIGVVFQRPLRLEATAQQNIALGNWALLGADTAQVERVAHRLGVHSFIAELPRGYDTRLGRMFGEHDLSGGQWQLLAIARALASDPAIVILDEPTSGLDVYAEAQLLRAMRALTHKRTSIVISHRFSTVADADRILVLDHGRVAELGTHEQLLSAGGIYAAMWRTHHDRAA